MENRISVVNANENNLKNVSVEIPKGCLCGICGISGSGKSTLACDVIARYAINAFYLGIPQKLRRKLLDFKDIDVEEIKEIPPVMFVGIKEANKSIRSTVATVSGLMTILRNMFSMYAITENELTLNLNSKVYPRLFSYNIKEEEGGGACSYCMGTGKTNSIRVEDIILNEEKSILSGALSVVNEKGIKYTKVSELFINAFCKEYGIDIELRFCDLSEDDKKLLLYGSDKIISFTDKVGAKGGKKSLVFSGIIGELLATYSRTGNKNIESIVKPCSCKYCNGTRYNPNALQYRVNDYTIADFLAMNIQDLSREVKKISECIGKGYQGILEEILEITEELKRIGVGYLSLNRAVSTISGGELQRIKLAKLISMKLEGYCYVIDEPSTGLHDTNIIELMESIYLLKEKGNTVLLIEHNPMILKECDFLIEMGLGGGKDGGQVIAVGTPAEIIEAETSTGKMLVTKHKFKENRVMTEFRKIGIYEVSVNNLKKINLEIPMNKFVTISGVSGSGKSSAINTALYNALNDYLKTGKRNFKLFLERDIKGIANLKQDATVTNSRSNVCTLLGLMSEIKSIFSNLWREGREVDQATDFEVCSFCRGYGYVEDEDMNEQLCELCDGMGYEKEILELKYKGYNIVEFLSLSIKEIVNLIEEEKIKKILQLCCDLGLDYISLDRKSPSLSKGEYQRIRIVKEICKHQKDVLYILDEPSKGLHFSDVKKVINTLKKLVEEGNTVIAIEHNLQMIFESDYVIEFGPGAGEEGGRIVFHGEPNELIRLDTHTAKALHGLKIDTKNENTYKSKNIVKVVSEKSSFSLFKRKINVLRGSIASGKTVILRNLLYANPLKTYINISSTQGKYLTKEIEAEKNYGDFLPLARLISCESNFFDKKERIVETLNLTSHLEKLFHSHGEGNEKIVRNSFNTSKRAGKCKSCQGFGKILSYNFDMLFSNKICEKDLNELLRERSRLSRIAPLIRERYEIDIAKEYSQMTDEEKQVFIYGDRKKEVYYEPKKKKYFWEGCNAFLFSNMSYASETLKNIIKPTYDLRTCTYCETLGVNSSVAKVTYKNVSFKDFYTMNISTLCMKLKNSVINNRDEERLVSFLEQLIKFGEGALKLGDYTSELNYCSRMILLYVLYCMNPLAGTMIVWDDFGAITNQVIRKKLVGDFEEKIRQDMTFLIADNGIIIDKLSDKYNEIILDNCFVNNVDSQGNMEFSNVIITLDDTDAVDRDKVHFSGREIFGNQINVISLIRDKFRKEYKQYKFTGIKDEEKCEKCSGTGYYEVNLGSIGIGKCECPDCKGSGYSKLLNSLYINGKNIGELMKMPLEELYVWSNKYNHKDIIDKIEPYVKVGLFKINISEKLKFFSSKEISLYFIAQFLEGTGIEIKLLHFFENIGRNEYEAIIARMNELARIKNKKILIVKE